MMTLKKIIETCRKLRQAFEQDEARFFLGLVEIEDEHLQVLRDAGHDTFDEFLERNSLCRVIRYRSFRKGLEHTSPEKALRMGTQAVMALAHVEEKKSVSKFETAVFAWSDEHGGVAPSRETAHRILHQIEPREQIPRAVRTVSIVGRLRAELQQKEADLSAARKRVKELEAELATYKTKTKKAS